LTGYRVSEQLHEIPCSHSIGVFQSVSTPHENWFFRSFDAAHGALAEHGYEFI
jgi:hypothetical protein